MASNVDDSDDGGGPPLTLFEYAMNLSRGIDPVAEKTAAWHAARVTDVLVDRGDLRTVLRSVSKSVLFSQHAFWEYVSKKEEANRLYITTVPQAMRWMAAVCLEYVSHAFPPLERELNRSREEMTRMTAQVATATRIMNGELEAAKGFRAETAVLQGKLEKAEEVNKLARVRMAKHIDAIRVDAGIAVGELQFQVDKLTEELRESKERYTECEVRCTAAVQDAKAVADHLRAAMHQCELKMQAAVQEREEAMKELRDAVALARTCEETAARVVFERDFARKTSTMRTREVKRLADALEAAGVKRRQQFATLVRDAQVNAKANQAGMPMPQAGMGSTIDHATGAPQAWPSLPEDEQHIGRQRGAGGEHWHSGEPEAAQHWYCGGEEGARGDPAPGASVVPVEYSGEADPLIGCHDGWHTPGPGMPPSVASDGTGWLSPIKGPGPRPSTAAADPSSSAAPLSDTDTVAALTRLRRENAALKKKLELHRQRTATLTSRVGRLEQELAARTDTPVVQPLGPLS